MTATAQNFEVYQGDAAIVSFAVTDDDGSPLDLSSIVEIVWSAQRTLTSAPVLTKTLTGGGITFSDSVLGAGPDDILGTGTGPGDQLGGGVSSGPFGPGSDGVFQLKLGGADTSALTGYYLHKAVIIDSLGNRTTVAIGRLQVGRLPSWTYSGDPSSSPLDQIRFQLGDTDADEPQLYDEEINWAFAVRGNVWGATAMCALALAARYSRLTSISADGVSQALNQRAAQFRLIAADYQRKETIYGATAFLGGVSRSDMRTLLTQADRVPDVFRLGLSDFPPNDGVAPSGGPPSGVDDVGGFFR